jgi:hypothetical protein
MSSTRASDPDREIALSFTGKAGKQIRQEICKSGDNLFDLLVSLQILDYLAITAGKWPQFGDEMRVR